MGREKENNNQWAYKQLKSYAPRRTIYRDESNTKSCVSGSVPNACSVHTNNYALRAFHKFNKMQ